MGSCRECGGYTPYPHNNAWCFTCFFFDYKEPRMYLAFLLTLIWEQILNIPISDNSIRVLLLQGLYEATNSVYFLLGRIIIEIIIFLGSFFVISLFLYKLGKQING